MKTLVIKNYRSCHAYDEREAIINFRDFSYIEKVPTHEVEGKWRYRITLFATHHNYDLCNLSKREADHLMQRLLDFSRCDAKGETLTITTDPDKITIKEN